MTGYRQTGLSLVELMVALVIGLLLMLGLVEIFGASKNSYLLAQGLSRTQENGRFAMDFLQRDLRMSGHFGCVSDQAHFTAGNGSFSELFLSPPRTDFTTVSSDALRFDYSIMGYEAVGTSPGKTLAIPATPVVGAAADWKPALPAGITALAVKPVKGSDILVVRFLSPESAEVTNFNVPKAGAATIDVKATQWPAVLEGATNPGLFAIADCRAVTLFQANTIAANKLTVTAAAGVNKSGFDGSDSFGPGQARVYRADSFIYYVGINPVSNSPTLYRASYNAAPGTAAVLATPEPLVEGVENLQLLYGQDRNRTAGTIPTGYIDNADTAETITDQVGWQRVGSVKLGMLVRSPDQASAPARTVATYVTGTQLTRPNDGRYRGVYEIDVALRNRLYGN